MKPKDERSSESVRALPLGSRLLHRADLAAAHPTVAWSAAAVVAIALVVLAANGFDESWQLVFCTLCAAATVIMVFALQHAQHRSQRAIQLKLDEIVRALPGADNRVVRLEAAGDAELADLEDQSMVHHRAVRE